MPDHEARALANELRDTPAVALRETKGVFGFERSLTDYCQAAVEVQ